MIEKRIFPLIKRYSRFVYPLLLAALARALIGFVAPVAVREMLEAVALPEPSVDALLFYAGVFAGCFLLTYAVGVAANYLYLRFSFRFKTLLSRELYEDMFRMDYKVFQGKEAPYFVTRLKQFTDQAFGLAADNLPAGVVSLVTAAVAVGFIWSINPWLCLMAVVLLPLNFYGYRSLNRRLKEKSSAFQAVYAENFRNILGVAGNLESIKQLNNYPFFSGYVGRYVDVMEREASGIALFARNSSMLMLFLVEVLRNGILLGSIYLLFLKRVSFADVMFLMMIMNIYFSALADMTNITMGLRDVKAGFDFLEGEVRAHAEKSGPASLAGVESLSVRMEKFSYDGKRDVLRNFALDLRPGDSVAVVGSSGCGKSTLGRLLTRLYLADGIAINGRPASDYSLESLRRRVYHVSQSARLFPGTVAENITAGLAEPDQRRYGEVIALDFMRDLREGRDGLSLQVKDGGANLSGGQRQRVTLARMLMHDPDVVLLDEATAALDGAAEESLLASVKELCRGKILIYVSHRLSTVKQAGRIMVMKDGAVESSGTYAELRDAGGEFRRLFAAQM